MNSLRWLSILLWGTLYKTKHYSIISSFRRPFLIDMKAIYLYVRIRVWVFLTYVFDWNTLSILLFSQLYCFPNVVVLYRLRTCVLKMSYAERMHLFVMKPTFLMLYLLSFCRRILPKFNTGMHFHYKTLQSNTSNIWLCCSSTLAWRERDWHSNSVLQTGYNINTTNNIPESGTEKWNT